jgi:hypothetical protein
MRGLRTEPPRTRRRRSSQFATGCSLPIWATPATPRTRRNAARRRRPPAVGDVGGRTEMAVAQAATNRAAMFRCPGSLAWR